jgi:hypothetical protein
MVLPRGFYRGSSLLPLLDRRNYFLNRNPSLGGNGNRGTARPWPVSVLHLGRTRDVPIFQGMLDGVSEECKC